jgi:hypothetical protein
MLAMVLNPLEFCGITVVPQRQEWMSQSYIEISSLKYGFLTMKKIRER